MRRGREQALAPLHRTVDIDDDGKAAPNCFGANVGAELRTAALGRHRIAVFQHGIDERKLDFHNSDRGR